MIGLETIAYATNDDPGAGRLSGNDIPYEFYESSNVPTPFSLQLGTSFSESPYVKDKNGKPINYTHHSAFDGMSVINMIDVSEWQKEIDWAKVKADGIEYAIIRVGYRGYGEEGTLSEATKDKYFETNMQNAIANGIKVGVYIFSQAITEEEAREEARYILNHIGSYKISLPLVMDYEYSGVGGGRIFKANLSKKKATNVCLAFADEIKASGYTPMIYANPSMLNTQLIPSEFAAKGYPVWLANYTSNTSYNGDFKFWQYSSSGSVDGISGRVDMNFYYTTNPDEYNIFNSSIITPVPNQTYTGTEIMPPVTVTYNGIVIQENVDYTLSYQNNVKIGEATIQITGQGIYGGIKKITFQIVPSAVENVKSKKRGFNYITVSWKKDTNASGYHIYRSDSLNGTYSRVKNIKNNYTTSYKNTKLKEGTAYYYKVRSYKKVGDTTYYGSFSTPKLIFTKNSYIRNALTKQGAYIYDIPSTSGNHVATLTKNKTMSVYCSVLDSNNSGWYYVNYKYKGYEYKGYIPSKKVRITKVGKIANTSIVNVRKEASTNSKKLTTLRRNKEITVLKSKKKKGMRWYQVSFKKNGRKYEGWISASYVRIQ